MVKVWEWRKTTPHTHRGECGQKSLDSKTVFKKIGKHATTQKPATKYLALGIYKVDLCCIHTSNPKGSRMRGRVRVYNIS